MLCRRSCPKAGEAHKPLIIDNPGSASTSFRDLVGQAPQCYTATVGDSAMLHALNPADHGHDSIVTLQSGSTTQ